MKKIYSLLLVLISYASFGQTIYSENFGTPTGNTTVAAYITSTAPATFQNTTPIVYTGTSGATSLRTSTASSGYSGASGNGNVFLSQTTNLGHFIQIDGINTSAFSATNLQLSFGYNTTSTSAAQLIVEQSTNGTTWTPLTFTPSATGWSLVTVTGGQIPSSTTLSLRFTQPSTVAVPNTGQFRIDDVRVFNFDPTCTLVLSNPTAQCDNISLGIDTYTVSIPYTGGTPGAYTFTPSSGTVGGDNPATLAAGTITVSGVTEGTGFTMTITKGSCSYSTTALAPLDCKPVSALPYYEPFAYAEASSLGASQQWSNVNTGDNIIVAGGSIAPAYPGLNPSTTGFVIFDGVGIDCVSPFTSVNTGTVYYSFLLNVASMTGVSDANGGYFAAFGSNPTNLGATLWSKRIDDTSFNLGIEVRTATGASTSFATATYQTGQTYFVVVGYTFNPAASDDSVDLWVNPVIGAAQPAATISDAQTAAGTDLSTISNFLLRQDSATETPSVQIDELRIGTTWTQVTGGTLGTNNNNIAGLRVYPNPVTNGTLFIETTANAEKSVTIFDVLGKQVLNTTTTDSTINVNSLNSGVYIIKITEEGKTASRKLVIK
ncbi:T9SS type A sorting domain-containing protein [Flavobacterium sp. j3]|uniref:T9SS type A sorting domain-containing protein n=1 Tax=Flavobacterium aureirubrum TaxID=3133147 RepID=A0ABU9N4H1_9FLAO